VVSFINLNTLKKRGKGKGEGERGYSTTSYMDTERCGQPFSVFTLKTRQELVPFLSLLSIIHAEKKRGREKREKVEVIEVNVKT